MTQTKELQEKNVVPGQREPWREVVTTGKGRIRLTEWFRPDIAATLTLFYSATGGNAIRRGGGGGGGRGRAPPPPPPPAGGTAAGPNDSPGSRTGAGYPTWPGPISFCGA
jgi:hypothetical protein